MTVTNTTSIGQSGTFKLGELSIHRLGFGAMRLTGPGIWGPPKDRAHCVAVLRRAAELGVNFIDTADSYGPNFSEEIIREALHPYPKGMVIATKAGLARTAANVWVPLGRPEYLQQQCETSSRRLGVDHIDLFQLHRIDPKVPADEQFGALKELVDQGKARYIGLSEVSVKEIEAARKVVPIVSVQNRYNLTDRSSEAVLDYCTKNNIAFIPWFPIAAGELTKPGGLLDKLSKETGATPSQLALAWLLKRSPVIVPIPGTSSVDHLEENCGAASVKLTDQQFDQLSKAVA